MAEQARSQMTAYLEDDSSPQRNRKIEAYVELPGMISCADVASENAETFFRTPVKLLLGSTLDLFLDMEILASIRTMRDLVDPPGLVTFLGSFRVGTPCTRCFPCWAPTR
jgi:hypothetical protein